MLPLVMVLAFLLTPVLEIYLLVQLGQVIGGWWTVLLLLAETLLGVWIVRREGRRAWRALQETLQRGVMPDKEIADAALVLSGGVLIVVPGLITDVVGLLFVLPFTRPLVRSLMSRWAARRVRQAEARGVGPMFPPGLGPFGPQGRDEGSAGVGVPKGPVVRGEVVDEDPPKNP